jgi:hypothetical protein
MNGRLGDLLLQAEQKACKNQKVVNALKRGLRQNGVKLEGYACSVVGRRRSEEVALRHNLHYFATVQLTRFAQ